MAAEDSTTSTGSSIVAVFHNTDAFVGALRALLEAGFDRAAISVLASHDAVKDHFGSIPEAETLADRPDTPREDLDPEGGLRAAIRFIAETVAVIGEIGVAGMAYAVGGPVGVAAGAASTADSTVTDVMSRFVEDQYRARFDQSVRDGGVICWVEALDAEAARKAHDILTASGGDHVHKVDF